MTIVQTPDEPEGAPRAELDRILASIQQFLEWQRQELEQFNTKLAGNIRRHVEARRALLQRGSAIQAGLGIKLRERLGAPAFERTPLQLKQVVQKPAERPQPIPVRPVPEPTLEEKDYEGILRILRHMGRTFEQAPRAFAQLEEEWLRDVLLAALNGIYEGEANAEAFRRAGKTDIRIEANDRSAFVAECKVWHSPGELTAALDQLLGYVTWRDAKTALVLFNKDNARFDELLAKIAPTVRSHGAFRREILYQPKGEMRFSLAAPQDGHELTLHVLAWHLHLPAK